MKNDKKFLSQNHAAHTDEILWDMLSCVCIIPLTAFSGKGGTTTCKGIECRIHTQHYTYTLGIIIVHTTAEYQGRQSVLWKSVK